MGEIGELEELQHEYAKRHKELIRNSLESDIPRSACYPGTHFSTVKEIFENSTTKYAERPFVLETFNKKKGFETRNDVKVKTNGNVRMDYMISQDKKFVAAQLFRFIPYTYEPASSVFYFTGDDASAFVHCLETSEF